MAPTTIEFQFAGRQRFYSISDPFYAIATFAYDSVGNRLTRDVTPDQRTTYSYDALDRLAAETNWAGERTTSTYDAANRRTLLQKADTVRASFTFDAADRLLARYDLRPDNSVVQGVDYQYDNAGNRTRMREESGRLTTWTYDDSYQLTGERRSSAAGGFHITYGYDPVGNRLQKGSTGIMTISTFDAADQLVTSVGPTGTVTYTFDAAGNQQIDQAPEGTTTRTWNYENQPTLEVLPSGARVTMQYNADWRCTYKDPS